MSVGQEIGDALDEMVRHARGEETGVRVYQVQDPNIKAIRARLGLSQAQFAARFGVSIGTLRGWEYGRRRPDGPARMLLRIIEREPEAAARALGLQLPEALAAK